MAMREINQDPGCVYDTLAFLSEYFDAQAKPADNQETPTANFYYQDIKLRLVQRGVSIPHYLRPFFHRKGPLESLLYNITFERPYSECTFERLNRMIKNQAYIKRSLAEYYFPHAESGEIRKLLDAEHPGVMDLLKRKPVGESLESCLLYAFLRFEAVQRELVAAVESVYSVIAEAHQNFLSQTDIAAALRKDPVLRKLRAIAGSVDDGEPPSNFSLSLIHKDIISHHPDDPSFFLLGYAFELSLEREHRYCGVSPFTFAQAINNPAKYDIFRTLAGNPPMTAADISKKLHLSKNALTYNLKEMQASGMLVVDHVKGLTFYYRLDFGYIQVISEQLGTIAALNK